MLAVLGAFQESAPLGPFSSLPPAVPMRLAGPEPWRVEPVAPPPPEPSQPIGGYTIRVAGRAVAIRPAFGFDRVVGHAVGRDGSVLVHRWSYGINSVYEDSILYQGADRPVPEGLVSHYRDRLDYAGAKVDSGVGISGPLVAPQAFVVERGRGRDLGPGSVREWSLDGTLVIEVPIDAEARPSGTEMTEGAATRILQGGKEWRVRGYGFGGRTKDGAVVLVSGPSEVATGSGSIVLGTRSLPRSRVLLWRDGRWVGHYQAPPAWRVAGVAPDGWLLMRREVPTPAGEPDLSGLGIEQANTALDRIMKAQEDATTREERDWRFGLFRADVLTPATFARPKGTDALLWRETPYAYGARAFRFAVFYGDDERCFRARPAT